MKPNPAFFALLVLMMVCGVAVRMGNLDPDVSLDSARELWSDVLRDVDDFGLHATRVSAYKEMELGEQMASQLATGMPEDSNAAQYVTAVGSQLLPNVNRKSIRYHFHVIESPEINAFALPGGQIYVLRGLLDFLQSEAELAAVLGHEISHVDLRHCIEQYQYQLALKNVGMGEVGSIAGFAHTLVALGYKQDQELEADAAGERLTIEAGYDPDAATAVFKRMQIKFAESKAVPATTPAGELGQAVGDAIGSYFRTHPPSEARVRQLSAMTAKNRSELAGRIYYRGVRNYRMRIARDTQNFAEEQHVY
ncbi:MAG TPA: M48 family metalloprotease [Bryobacteraceae bacterium]|nr:M48 family metalloprotease [Bryobacteraceae bacterium]